MLHFIRHAQSHYNHDSDKLDKQLRQQMGDHFHYNTQEFLALKFDQKYVDAELTQAGKQQCLAARQQMAGVQVDLVVVSPMRRAMQTCDLIFRDHPSKPRIIVEPGVRQIFSSSCDIGSRLQETMNEIPYFDYSRITYPSTWYLHSIKNQAVKGKLLEGIIGVPAGEHLRKRAEKVMLEYLKEIYGKENQYHFSDLPGQKSLLKQLAKDLKNVAVVSHYENIFRITNLPPKNAQVLSVPLQQL